MSKVISVRVTDGVYNDLMLLFEMYEKKVGIKINRNAFYNDAIEREALEHIIYLQDCLKGVDQR